MWLARPVFDPDTPMTHRSGFAAGRTLVALAALSLASVAHAGITVFVGGLEATANPNDLNNMLAGDQATVALDGEVQFAYERKGSAGTGAVAYFDRHVFCADVQSIAGVMSFEPRYQIPEPGADVWKFPNFQVQGFEYAHTGGGFAARVNQIQTPASPLTRCLTAQPGESYAAWDVDRGLFGEGFGDYPGQTFDAGAGILPPQDWPSTLHQNFRVVAKQFPGHASGRDVSIVRVEVQKHPAASALRTVSVVLVDGFNGSALNGDVRWCLLHPYAGFDYDNDWVPPTDLCRSAPLFPGTLPQDGDFLLQGLGFSEAFHPAAHILVSRGIAGTPAAGQPKQGFAALRLDLAVSFGVTEDKQDWYLKDSVWYNY